jgi:hypothetical protein
MLTLYLLALVVGILAAGGAWLLLHFVENGRSNAIRSDPRSSDTVTDSGMFP